MRKIKSKVIFLFLLFVIHLNALIYTPLRDCTFTQTYYSVNPECISMSVDDMNINLQRKFNEVIHKKMNTKDFMNEKKNHISKLFFFYRKFTLFFSLYFQKNMMKLSNGLKLPIDLNLKNIRFESKELSKNWLNITKSVVKLHLNSLILHWIQKDAFDTIQFEKLSELKIQSCIQFFFDGAFNGLGNLKILSLINTQIIGFPKKLLEPLRSLEWFSMQECLPQEISIDNLFGPVNLPNIEKVEILNCNLSTTINDKTFSGLTNVNELILERNNIVEIGQRSFDIVLQTLHNLRLTTNQLKSLPNLIFKNAIKSHTKINLQRNPWRCDCKLEHLRRFVIYAKNIDIDQIICNTPKMYAEKKLGLLSPLCPIAPSNESNVIASSAHIEYGTNHVGSTKNSPKNLNLVIYLPKKIGNGSGIHLHLTIQLVFVIFFHLVMFFV